MTGLDGTDIEMALVAVRYYLRGLALVQRTPDVAAFRLAHHLELLMSVDGHDSVVRQQEWLTVNQAAQRTGKSERHTRRIAAKVGRKVGRQGLEKLTDDNYVDALIRQKVAEMTDREVDALLAETRPPTLDPKETAAEAVRAYRGHRT